jgi:L-asparaginase / beta-aspartyl-peptidase
MARHDQSPRDFGFVIHGGAWDIPDETVQDHLNGVARAGERAFQMLAEGSPALDVVEAAVSLMEDDPTFDAGKGSFCNAAGQVEMDAIIATTSYRIGGVCALQNIKNPVQVARKVMEETDHVLLAGQGAFDFASAHGFSPVPPEDLLVGRELERYYKIHAMEEFVPKDTFGKSPQTYDKPNGMGTVGCVCRDQDGRYAVAVSTGGSPYKMAGRVGDTPLWGSGGYLNQIGASAATGYGEDLIKILATFRVCENIRHGKDATDATREVIHELGREVNGLGGLIAIDADGIGLAFNTPRMAFAYRTSTMARLVIGIEPRDLDFQLHR